VDCCAPRSARLVVRRYGLRWVLEFLWWCGADGIGPPPSRISARAFEEARRLISDYFVPMAERTYGDALATQADRNAATLARWILRERNTKFTSELCCGRAVAGPPDRERYSRFGGSLSRG